MLDMFLIFLYLWRFALCPKIWSVLETVPHALENACSAALMHCSITSIWPNVSFKSDISLLTFCLDDLSIDVNRVLKFPIVIVQLSVSPFRSANSCFIYVSAPRWGAYTLMLCLLDEVSLYHYIMFTFASCYLR